MAKYEAYSCISGYSFGLSKGIEEKGYHVSLDEGLDTADIVLISGMDKPLRVSGSNRSARADVTGRRLKKSPTILKGILAFFRIALSL